MHQCAPSGLAPSDRLGGWYPSRGFHSDGGSEWESEGVVLGSWDCWPIGCDIALTAVLLDGLGRDSRSDSSRPPQRKSSCQGKEARCLRSALLRDRSPDVRGGWCSTPSAPFPRLLPGRCRNICCRRHRNHRRESSGPAGASRHRMGGDPPGTTARELGGFAGGPASR